MAVRAQNEEIYRKYLQRLGQMYNTRSDIRMFTEIVLSALAVIVFFLFAIRPTLTTIAGLWTEIQSKEETVAIMEEKIENLSQAKTTYDDQRVNVSLLNQAIPDNTNLDTYTRQIEGLSKTHGLVVQGMSTSEVPVLGFEDVEPEGNEELEAKIESVTDYYLFNFTVVGDFENIRNFIGDFENMRRPMLSETISVQLSSGEYGEIAFSVEGLVPYLKSSSVVLPGVGEGSGEEVPDGS